MKQVTINIPDHMDAETAECLINYVSYLTIKGEYPYTRICSNAKRLCYKCQQPECDFAGVKFSDDKTVRDKEAKCLTCSNVADACTPEDGLCDDEPENNVDLSFCES